MKQKDKGKKHILVVSQYFYPEAFRINDMCKEWVDRGYKVTVVTGIPNYPEGKFYKGYGLFKKRKETWNGIDIIRIPLVSRGRGRLRLMLNYFSFVFFGFFWRIFTRIKPDEVFIYEVSPVIQAKIGTGLAKRRKIPCSIYVLDIWPETVQTMLGIQGGFMINYIDKTVRKIYRRCDRIFISSRKYEDSIKQRCDNPEKIIYWPQYAETFYVPKPLPENKEEYKVRKDDKFNVLFAGNIGYAQGLGTLVSTAKLFKENGINDVNFILVGNGRYKQTLLKLVEDNGVAEWFTFKDRVPAQEISDYFAETDVSLVSLGVNPIYELTLPAKLQSCLACGKPVLVCANGEIQNVVNEADCGYCVSAENDKELYECIIKMKAFPKSEMDKMSENAVKYCAEHFDKNKLMNQMDEYFNR